MGLAEIIAIGAPLLGEAIGLLAQLPGASAERTAEIVAKLAAAMTSLKEARAQEYAAHAARTEETLAVIADAAAHFKAEDTKP